MSHATKVHGAEHDIISLSPSILDRAKAIANRVVSDERAFIEIHKGNTTFSLYRGQFAWCYGFVSALDNRRSRRFIVRDKDG